jgi:PAS domain S-box-containing protein
MESIATLLPSSSPVARRPEEGHGWSTAAAHALLEKHDAATAVVDRDMRYLAANARWRDEFQPDRSSLVGLSHYEVFSEVAEEWRALYVKALAGQPLVTDCDLVVRPDGSQNFVRWNLDPWPHADGSVGGLILSCRLLTNDAPLEQSMKSDAALARSFMQDSIAACVTLDLSGRLEHANQAAHDLCGSIGAVEGQTMFWNAFIPVERREAARDRLLTLLAHVRAATPQTWPVAGGPALQTKGEPEYKIVDWAVYLRRDAEQHAAGLLLMAMPSEAPASPFTEVITPPPAAESAPPINDSFRQMAEASPFGMMMLSDRADVVYANPQHRAVLGFSIEECGGLNAWLERATALDDVSKKQLLDEWWERVWRRRAPWTCSLRNAEGLIKEIEFRPAALAEDRLLLTIFDVTDAQLEDQAIRASEARYRGLFQQCAAGVVMLNASGNVNEANPAFELLTGASKLDLRRHGIQTYLPEADLAGLRENAEKTPGQTFEIITPLQAKNGTRQPVRLSLATIRNEAGAPVFTACYLQPTSEISLPSPATTLVRTEYATPDVTFTLDGECAILSATIGRDFATILGHAELLGRQLDDILPKVAALLPLDTMLHRLSENPTAETRCEFSCQLDDKGETRALEARMVQLGAASDVPRYALTLRDVTTAVQNARAVGDPQPWLANLSLPMLLANERGRIASLNPAAEKFLGYATADLVDHGLFRIFRPENPRSFSAEISSHLSTERRWQTRTTVQRHDGTTREVEVELVPVPATAAGGRGFIATLRPIDARPAHARPVVTLHRARNDLQILSSLIALQTERADTESASHALRSSRDRLSAVALIYRQISGEDEPVDFTRYINDLSRTILESHRAHPDRVTIETKCDAIHLPQKTAVSLGIILQELISLSLTESFPGETQGIIRINLTLGSGEGVLILRDTGRLLDAAARSERSHGLAWQIVESLSEQIGGVLTLMSDLENQVRLRFRYHPAE